MSKFISESSENHKKTNVAVIRAVTTLNCQNKLRIHYFFPWPITRKFVSELTMGRESVREFSKVIPGGLDHFEFQEAGRYAISGALGSLRCLVTYAKSTSGEHFCDEYERRIAELSQCQISR